MNFCTHSASSRLYCYLRGHGPPADLEKRTMDFLKAAGSLADDIFNLLDRTAKKLESPGRATNRDSILGRVGEVVVAIEPGKVGEVAVILSGCLHTYPARAVRPAEQFGKGSKVRIADVGSNLIFVESHQDHPMRVNVEIIENCEKQ